MKYIGPFLRINALNKSNVENQLYYLAKESLKNITLNSKCGITIKPSELKLKNEPNIDINTINSFSPLICLYRKASTELVNKGTSVHWDEDSFKHEITIFSNAFMTLSLLELTDYYKQFENISPKKYALYKTYITLCRKQLEFYASYLRNEEGVFVDKKDISDSSLDELKFEQKNKKFRFSDQALLMAAYYKYSTLVDVTPSSDFKTFSLDILNMLITFKNDIYTESYEDLLYTCLALNLFYKYSNIEEAKCLLIDLSELLLDNFDFSSPTTKIHYECLIYINSVMLYKNLDLLKFENISEKLYEKIIELYDPELGLFIKKSDSKEITYSSEDIILYLISALLHKNTNSDSPEDDLIIIDIFKKQIIESGLILSWPETPTLDDTEKYRNFSLKSEDMLEDHNFRMPNISTPESSELASVFIKSLVYNRKKDVFKPSKTSFDADKNMLLFFMIIYLYKSFNKF